MWPNPQENTDLATFTEEILMETLFLVQCLHKKLMYNKNFNSRLFAEKNNEKYFPRSLKSLLRVYFEGHFWSFFLVIQKLNFYKLASLGELSSSKLMEKLEKN